MIQKRKEWIDALRATAMLFVIAGHLFPKTTHSWIYYLITSPIKIPLFFAITGYVFNDRNGDILGFLRNLVKKIIIPWLLLSLIYCIGSVPFKGINSFLPSILDVVIGSRFWYMNCHIVAVTVFFCTVKFGKKLWIIICSSVVLCIIGLLLGKYNVLNFFMVNRALVAQGFIALGYILKRSERFNEIKGPCVFALIGLYIILCITSYILFPGYSLDVHRNYYYNYVLCFAMIFIGCITMFAAYKQFQKIPGVVLFIGQNTLVFFILGSFASSVFSRVIPLLPFEMSEWSVFLISFLLDCTFAGAAAYIINRFFPFIIGKTK